MRDNLPNMLKAAAKEWREENKVVATGATRYDAALKEAADAIEELMRRSKQFQYMPPPAWIPVTERQPEEAGYYITAFGKGEVGQNLYMTFADGSGKWYQNSEDTGAVTHWMPLPEQPKEE